MSQWLFEPTVGIAIVLFGLLLAAARRVGRAGSEGLSIDEHEIEAPEGHVDAISSRQRAR